MKQLILFICIIICGCSKSDAKKELIEQKITTKSVIVATEGVDTLWVDKLGSKIQWIGQKVTGEHSGQVKVAGGYIVVNDSKLSSGEILINMQSITVDDIENPGKNQSLVSHLKDGDFFNTEEFPTAKFIFNKFSGENENTNVVGNMTIRDKTVPTELTMNVVVNQDTSFASGTIKIDRTLFGIKYGSGSFFDNLGDRMILDNFILNFMVIAR